MSLIFNFLILCAVALLNVQALVTDVTAKYWWCTANTSCTSPTITNDVSLPSTQKFIAVAGTACPTTAGPATVVGGVITNTAVTTTTTLVHTFTSSNVGVHSVCACVLTTGDCSDPTTDASQFGDKVMELVFTQTAPILNDSVICFQGVCDVTLTGSLNGDNLMISDTACTALTTSSKRSHATVTSGKASFIGITSYGATNLCYCNINHGLTFCDTPTSMSGKNLSAYNTAVTMSSNTVVVTPFPMTSSYCNVADTTCTWGIGSVTNDNVQLYKGDVCPTTGLTSTIPEIGGKFAIPATEGAKYTVCYCHGSTTTTCPATSIYPSAVGAVYVGPEANIAKSACAQGSNCTFTLTEEYAAHSNADKAILTKKACRDHDSSSQDVIQSALITSSAAKQAFTFVVPAAQETGDYHVCVCTGATGACLTLSTPQTVDEQNAHLFNVGTVDVTTPSTDPDANASVSQFVAPVFLLVVAMLFQA